VRITALITGVAVFCRRNRRPFTHITIQLRHAEIQEANRLAGADKIEQETRGLRKIGDSFRKIVVVDGVQPFYTDESGVSFISLMDFMLNRDILG
jgi:hypothetical protein